MVDLDGRFVVRARDQIGGIAIHKTLENPLARVALSPALRSYLRDVWVGDDAAPTFTGWTTAFFDDLFLYFDLEGQTHVLDPEEIRRIRPSTIDAGRRRRHAPTRRSSSPSRPRWCRAAPPRCRPARCCPAG